MSDKDFREMTPGEKEAAERRSRGFYGTKPKSEPIVEIDMAVPRNFQQAIDLALGATDATGWGSLKTTELHRLAGDSEFLECAFALDEKGAPAISAITGNGLRSAANAEFYGSARRIVLGLVSEVDRLRTRDRSVAEMLQECVELVAEVGPDGDGGIGGDHKAAVEFLFDFVDRLKSRGIVAAGAGA